ncbi:MAG: universal stress protein [Desulfovibrio sp.]|uniref:universal stress protein n=1 Tax=Solidesulfovibrio sp. C21 TaxID=3398613 RepID=UPI0039FC5330
MEHILVCMTPRHGAFGALGRAVALARRIPAKVSVLFVTAPPEGQATPPLAEVEARRQLRLLVERARSEGVAIEWFVAEGIFEDEVIRFVKDRKVTLLVAETTDAEGRQSERETQSLRQILHRVSCRVELVSPRKDETATQPKGKAT